MDNGRCWCPMHLLDEITSSRQENVDLSCAVNSSDNPDSFITTTNHDSLIDPKNVTSYLYGLQVILLAVLVAITIYRKEMSCNRCYAESSAIAHRRPRQQNTTRFRSENVDDCVWDEQLAESLLDGAGCYVASAGTYRLLRVVFCICWDIVCRYLLYPFHHLFMGRPWASLESWWHIAAQGQPSLDDLLNGAENWCIAPPISSSPTSRKRTGTNEEENQSDERCTLTPFPAASALPMDSFVHIVSFLHARDIVSLACTSRQLHNVIDNSDDVDKVAKYGYTRSAVWKTIWYRDYSWIVESWDVGRQAMHRSFQSQSRRIVDTGQQGCAPSLATMVFSKDFYFRFGLSYVDYILAGHCTTDLCLVGLGGHIYDITAFLPGHPGSPETVIVHAGRDATSVFEGMRHTIAAQSLAQEFCIVVDVSQSRFADASSHAGVRPTEKLLATLSGTTDRSDKGGETSSLPLPVDAVKPQGCSTMRIASTLDSTLYAYRQERDAMQRQALSWLAQSSDAILGEAHVYYDPFCAMWKAWYINTNMEAVFLEQMEER